MEAVMSATVNSFLLQRHARCAALGMGLDAEPRQRSGTASIRPHRERCGRKRV